MNLQEYIENGMVESYLLGLATPEEAREMEHLLKIHPELRTEMATVELRLHHLWLAEAVPPPVKLRTRTLETYSWADTTGEEPAGKKPNYTFINIQPDKDKYITVHKVWKWIFIISFLLFKFSLFLAIFFYFKYRQLEERRLERQRMQQEQQLQPR